jgi:GxxExxY protein
MDLNSISSQIIKAAITVHKTLGPGLLESVYQRCMIIELEGMDLSVESEVDLPVFYKDEKITDLGFRLDLLVGSAVIVELKSVEKVTPVHKKQLLTYLHLAQKELGILINFNETLLKNGITRIILNNHSQRPQRSDGVKI